MIRRQQRVSAALCFTTLLVVSGSVYAANANRPSWLSSTEPTITKTLDLPVNQEPMSKSTDCTPMQLPNGSDFINTCAYKTPPGTLAGGYLLDGSKGSLPYDPWYGGAVLPSVPNHPDKLLTTAATRYGVMLRVGTYDATQLRYAEYYGPPTKRVYEYRGDTGPGLKDNSGRILSFWTNEVAYSANGDWLAGVAGANALIKYNINTGALWVISWDAASYGTNSGYQKTDSVAISDNGRYVAVTLTVPTNSGNRPALRVYDTQSCRDQSAYIIEAAKHNSCEYKDLWSGEYRTGNTRGLLEMVPGAEYPRRVRFVGDKTITFDTVYERTSATNFKVARYSVSMPQETTREYVGVLGMGDSYISGEGAAGTYFTGTDTKQNKCHLSWFSYPYRLGAQEFPYGRSVACSGAKMYDVTVASVFPEAIKLENEDKYGGQGADKYDTNWSKRDKENIISSFSPGYANQIIFAREYKPRTILLSIGGNDIGFSKILTTCVAGDIAGTCYQYYEDRVQLMGQILSQYDRLVKTYKSVLAESGGARVYVVGYPQILKEGGDCGVNVHMNAAEVKFGAQLITYLNGVIKRAAAEAGVYYVDTEAALNGHRLCEASKNKAGVNGLTNGDDKAAVPILLYAGGKTYGKTVGLGNESYHPTQKGHELLAQRVLSSTTNLTAPMPSPRANNKPGLDYSHALLKDIERLPEQFRHREAIKWSNGEPSVLLKEKKYTTNVPPSTLKNNSPTKITLRSEPITVFEGVYRENSPIIFTIPKSVPAGFHTVDIYGTGIDGESVDVREVIYVVEKADDFDGDGIKNTEESCLLVNPAGVDSDSDGVDDACDGELRDVSLDEPVPALPTDNPIAFEEDESDNELPAAQSLIVPFEEPQVKSTEENTASQTESNPKIQPKPSISNAGVTPELTTVLRLSGSLSQDSGYAFGSNDFQPELPEGGANSNIGVLGKTVGDSLKTTENPTRENHKTRNFTYVMALVATGALAIILYGRRTHRK